MNNKEVEKIKKLYESYSFIILDETEPNEYLAFSCKKGYFTNAEIILFDSSYDCKNLKIEYEKAGYAVKITLYCDFESLHNELFRGFFEVDGTLVRQKEMYNAFCQKQRNKSLLGDYSYKTCNYIVDGQEPLDDRNAIQIVKEQLSNNSASLVIIEAPAGFGKTCTSYEIMHEICSSDSICLLAELSKNRTATLFRYVLYSEIDAVFNGLKYDLVESEIRNGMLPIIIDGFDELLSKSIDEITQEVSDNKKEVQSMLNTISLLLNNDSKAKIILTSRKSSIFTGEIFDDWIINSELKCDITRIELCKPNVYSWIGDEKAKYIQHHLIELYNVANPILLNTISSIPLDQLKKMNTVNIIKQYFDFLLKREQNRQALKLSEREQQKIMRKLAATFVDYDINSEDSSIIKEMIKDILAEDLPRFVSRYSMYGDNEVEVPDSDQFVLKLVHHAFLDRISSEKNEIGFVNEFTFGYLIGEAVINGDLKIEKLGFRQIDLMATAFQSCSDEIKTKLYTLTKKAIDRLNLSEIIIVEQKLLNKILRSYGSVKIENLIFDKDFAFNLGYVFSYCSFYNCTFDNSTFDINSFYQCQFYNCHFINISICGIASENKQLSFIKCDGFELFSQKGVELISNTDDSINYIKVVLEQFWKPGKKDCDTRCGINTVYRGIKPADLNKVDEALDKLIADGIIKKMKYCYEINYSKIADVKKILGR